jgi:hypothetical protein
MAQLTETAPVQVASQVSERVMEIVIRRAAPGDPVQEPHVFKVVRLVKDGVLQDEQKIYALSDAERQSLWNSAAALTFQAWILNQVIPNADTIAAAF